MLRKLLREEHTAPLSAEVKKDGRSAALLGMFGSLSSFIRRSRLLEPFRCRLRTVATVTPQRQAATARTQLAAAADIRRAFGHAGRTTTLELHANLKE